MERITYKPGYVLSVDSGHMHIVSGPLPDSLASCQTVQVTASLEISESMDHWKKEDVIKNVKQLIVLLEMHEIDEWLKFDGKHVLEPHPSR
jgi:hypothetical protein